MRCALLLAAVAAAGIVAGCEGQPDNGTVAPPPSPQQVQATIDKINNDPNMNDAAKAQAIAAIKAAAERSAASPTKR